MTQRSRSLGDDGSVPVAPRNLVSAEGVRHGYAGRVLLDGVSLGVAEGDRIGVVGPNGGGKTTLLRLLQRRAEPDAGTVTHRIGLVVGLLDQADDLEPERTIRDLVIGGRADHEWQGDRRIRDVLDGLLGGVELTRFPQGLDTSVGPLSGGERRWIALARLLLDGPKLLLLDEPTNHLDVPSKDELESALDNYPGAVIFSSHDRFLLDRVATTVAEVKDGKIDLYLGGWSRFREVQAEREEAEAVA